MSRDSVVFGRVISSHLLQHILPHTDTSVVFFLVLFLFTEVFDLKMKYDESDNVMVRASRALTDRVSQLLGKSSDCFANFLSYSSIIYPVLSLSKLYLSDVLIMVNLTASLLIK